MPDEIDVAQAYEQQARDHALSAMKVRPVEEPVVVNGRRVCADCVAPLSAARLAALPHAVRCVKCQTLHEPRKRSFA